MLRLLSTLATLSAAALVAPAGPAMAADSPNDRLVGYVTSYLQRRNVGIVTPDATTTGLPPVGAIPMTPEFASRTEAAQRDLAARRERLVTKNVRYSDVRTQVRSADVVAVSPDTVTVTVDEYTELVFARVHGDEPPFAAYALDEVLTFVRTPDGWAMSDSRAADADAVLPVTLPTVYVDRSGVLVTTPGVDLGDVGAPGTSAYDCGEEGACTADDQVNVSLRPPPSLTAGTVPVPAPYKDVLASLSGTERRAGPPAGLDYSAMYRYATTHWDNYNPDFRSWPNDCTNFISQILRTGGWKHDTGWYKSNSNWWYNSVNQTFSWAGAENWAQFATRRTTHLNNVWELVWTDILQLDFDQNDNMNHSMFVNRTSSTNIYLAYHTSDHYNKPLTEILDQYPNAWYYAYRT